MDFVTRTKKDKNVILKFLIPVKLLLYKIIVLWYQNLKWFK